MPKSFRNIVMAPVDRYLTLIVAVIPPRSAEPTFLVRKTLLGNGLSAFRQGSARTELLTDCQRLGFHLRLKSGDRIHGRRVAFFREVKDAKDARAVFVEMVRQAKSPEAV